MLSGETQSRAIVLVPERRNIASGDRTHKRRYSHNFVPQPPQFKFRFLKDITIKLTNIYFKYDSFTKKVIKSFILQELIYIIIEVYLHVIL